VKTIPHDRLRLAAHRAAWALLLCAVGGLLAAFPARAAVHRPHCQVCGRFNDSSPSRVQACFRIKNHSETVDVCSLFCYVERREDFTTDPESLLVQAYPSGDDPGPWLPATRACYLYDAAGDTQLCSPPFVYAFRTKDEAKAAANDLGGEQLDWKETLERCTQVAADWEPPHAGDH
jgi:hypothetical protein